MDNNTSNFVNQLGNGIPITTFKKGMKGDVELIKLANYLTNLAKEKDFVKVNKEFFKFDMLPHADGLHRAYDLVLHSHSKGFVDALEKENLKKTGRKKVRF